MNIRAVLKRSQFLYFLKVRLTDAEFKENKKKMKSAIKSRKKIKEEMNIISDYWKCKPLHYIRYELFNKDLPIESLLDYIPPYYHYNYHFPYINKGVDLNYFKDKLCLYNLFSERQIPTPRVIGIIQSGKVFDEEHRQVSLLDIFSTMANSEKIFIKPSNGAGGTGIVVIKKQNDNYYLNGKEILLDAIDSIIFREKTYVIQKGIIQRNDINQINASSVNTLRIITQWQGNVPSMKVCVMRIGRNGKDLDNSHQGGLSIPVNVENGYLGNFATAEHGGGEYFKHPDSGFVFGGNRIEDWEGIKGKVISFARKIPELKEIAWDIAITPNGPMAIELNLGYGITHLQCCCGGMRRILNIYPNYEL